MCRKKPNYVILLVALAFLQLVVSCHRAPSRNTNSTNVSGKYICAMQNKSILPNDMSYTMSIEFKSDQRFEMIASISTNTVHIEGKYVINGQNLTVSYNPDKMIVFRVNSNSITTISGAFPGGLNFIKNESD